MTLQEFVDEINAQVNKHELITELPETELIYLFSNYVAMFRNEFNEVPNFDVDDYGRIILLRPEIYG